MVKKYVAKEELDKGAFVLLDPVLCDALLKGVVKKGEGYPTELAKGELADAFVEPS